MVRLRFERVGELENFALAAGRITFCPDDGKFAHVREILGTRTLRETIDRCFDEVITREARIRSIAQLQSMEGLDLDKPAVMDKAWR